MKVAISGLKQHDLPAMIALEREAWPEDVRASGQQLTDRLGTFPEGFFGAFAETTLVGMASCQVVRFDPNGPHRSWSELTANGWISKTHAPDGNCLHFVSICVHPGHRRKGIGTLLNETRLDAAKKLGLDYALTDTRLPGMGAYLEGHQGSGVGSYLAAVLHGKIVEPAVRIYLKSGFEPMGLIPNCMASDRESACYGLAMVKYLGGREMS